MKLIMVQNPAGFDVPAGSIILWFGTEAQLNAIGGWAVFASAEGQFVMGAAVGGRNLVSAGSLSHSHNQPATGAAGAHGHAVSASIGGSGSDAFLPGVTYDGAESHSHAGTGSTSNNPLDHAHSVPATGAVSSLSHYHRLYWIQKL